MLSARGLSRLQHLSCLPGFESQAPGPAWQDPVFLGKAHRGRTLCGGDSHQSVTLNFFARLALALPLPIQGPFFGPSARGVSERLPPTHFSILTRLYEPPPFPPNAKHHSNTPVSAHSRPLPFFVAESLTSQK